MKEDNKFVENCMDKNCSRDTYGGSRGLCINHYAVLQARVKRGGTTWKILEVEGRTKPKLTKEENSILRKHPQRKWHKEGRSIL